MSLIFIVASLNEFRRHALNEQNERIEQPEIKCIQGTLTAANLNPKKSKKKQAKSPRIESYEGDNIIALYDRAKERKKSKPKKSLGSSYSEQEQNVRAFLETFAVEPKKGEKLLTKTL